MMVEGGTYMERQGIIFIVSAPSGTGKTSLCNALVDSLPNLHYSISYTTRVSRQAEADGADYHFISKPSFQQLVEEDRLAEWAEVYGNWYGTPKDFLEKHVKMGHDLLLDIEGSGARQIMGSFPDAVTILVLPPSLNDLKKRLKGRGTEDRQALSERLEKAIEEIRESAWYQYLVVNDKLETATEKLKSIIVAERCKRERAREAVKPFLKAQKKP